MSLPRASKPSPSFPRPADFRNAAIVCCGFAHEDTALPSSSNGLHRRMHRLDTRTSPLFSHA
eukprot:4388313-Amphidinium_carterae.1